MKTLSSFLLLVVALFLLMPASTSFSQSTTATQISLTKGLETDVAAQCVGGIIYDDNTFENGYGWNPGFGIGKFVMLITPTSYPYTINQVCLGLTRTAAGSANFTFDIVVYDNTGTGGGPGTLIATIANQTATGVPVWPTVTFFDFTGLTTIPPLASGSYYVGLSWDPATMGSHYIGSDESATTTLRPGYGYIQSAWSTIQTNFPSYKALAIRVDGTGQTYAHNIGVGPYLSLPSTFNVGTQVTIKAKVSNLGTSNETGIPVKFTVDGTQVGTTTTLNLNAGAVDSVSFSWTPATEGMKTLKVISSLANDEYRANDTVTTVKEVNPLGQIFACIGTGTTAVGYPFYTLYEDSRTQMLYTSAEIVAAGGANGNIVKLGFNVAALGGPTMNGFTIKLMNTTSTSLTGFVTSGMTTVYTGTYAPPATGWQYITFTTPFAWTVGQNVLVEVCYDNSSWTGNSTVMSTAAAGMTWHYHTDGSSGCTMTGGTAQTTRPNLCAVINTIVGTGNPQSNIPSEFSLSQNYPNPFNPTTIINYSVPKASMVKLSVYDVLGREVTTLVNDMKQPGTYNVEFDASTLASGLYIYKIEAGNFTSTKKMLLVK